MSYAEAPSNLFVQPPLENLNADYIRNRVSNGHVRSEHTFNVTLWWSDDHKIVVTPTLHWRPDDQLTEGSVCFAFLTLCTRL